MCMGVHTHALTKRPHFLSGRLARSPAVGARPPALPRAGVGQDGSGHTGGGSHLAPAGLALGGGWAVASGCQGGAVRLQGCGEPSLKRSCWPGCGATLVSATRVPVGFCPVSFRIPAAPVALDSHMCFELWLQFQGKKRMGHLPSPAPQPWKAPSLSKERGPQQLRGPGGQQRPGSVGLSAERP